VDVGLTGGNTTPGLTTSINFQDTYHVALGNRFRINPSWLINTGFAWDSSMLKDQDRSVSLPIGQQFRFGLGTELQASSSLTSRSVMNWATAGIYR
jgi:long-chain fatty acid transport protein